MLVAILWVALLPFGLASINTTRVPASEGLIITRYYVYNLMMFRIFGGKYFKFFDSERVEGDWTHFGYKMGFQQGSV